MLKRIDIQKRTMRLLFKRLFAHYQIEVDVNSVEQNGQLHLKSTRHLPVRSQQLTGDSSLVGWWTFEGVESEVVDPASECVDHVCEMKADPKHQIV